MENILEFMRTDLFLIILAVSVLVIFILYIINVIKLSKIRKSYNEFMNKVGNGKDLEEILENHIDKINKTISKNDEIEKYVEKIDNDIKQCVQKVGLYRYNAYKDTGSDLSFTLALLNEKNDGVVLNGIYSREMSNIYAKPIQAGESTYKITNEESEAIKRAIN